MKYKKYLKTRKKEDKIGKGKMQRKEKEEQLSTFFGIVTKIKYIKLLI